MAIQIQLRQGTTTEHDTFTGAVGEVTVDTTKDTLVVHDGVTAGGFPVAARANTDGTISLIKKDGTVITTIPANGLLNNTLTSTATNQALTASQGKVLKDLVDDKLTTTSAFGVEQSMQDVMVSRVAGTTYTNTTARTIVLYISGRYVSGSNPVFNLYVDNIYIPTSTGVFVAPNSTYRIVADGFVVSRWVEFR